MSEIPFFTTKPLKEAFNFGKRLLGSANLNEAKKGSPHRVDTTPIVVSSTIPPQELEQQLSKEANIKVVSKREREAAAEIWQQLLAMDDQTSGDEAVAPENDLFLGNRAYQQGKTVFTGVEQKLGDMRPWHEQG